MQFSRHSWVQTCVLGIAHYRAYKVKIVSAFKAFREGGDRVHKWSLESTECTKSWVQKCFRIQVLSAKVFQDSLSFWEMLHNWGSIWMALEAICGHWERKASPCTWVGRGGTSQQWGMDCRAKTRKLEWDYVIGALNAKLSKEVICLEWYFRKRNAILIMKDGLVLKRI